jgi:predicted GIY-YIG superfamily endonuclease
VSKINEGWFLPHWVYRAFAADGSLLYIGVTRNPTQRMRSWRSARNKPKGAWVNEVVRWTWRRYPDHFEATEAERYAICSENPRHNVYPLPKYRPAWVAEFEAAS